MTKNVVMVRNTDIQTYKCPHCQEYVKLDRIEIDSVMCESIKFHNCFVKDNGRLSRITKLKRLVQNINNNNEFPAVCVVPIRLYTRPIDRNNGIQNYKYHKFPVCNFELQNYDELRVCNFVILNYKITKL